MHSRNKEHDTSFICDYIMLIFIVHLPNIAMLFEYFGAKRLWFQIKQKFRPKSKRMKKRILNVLFFIAGRVGTLKIYIFNRFFSKSFEHVKRNCFKLSGACKRLVLIHCLCDTPRMFVFFRCITKPLYGV